MCYYYSVQSKWHGYTTKLFEQCWKKLLQGSTVSEGDGRRA